MSLILKQEPANTIATPPAGKSTLFVNDSSVMSVKSPDGNVTTFPTVQGANTQVFFNDNGAINGNANLTFDKATSTMSVVNLSVTGNLNAGDINVSSIANGTSNVDIIGASGNVTTSVAGTANVLVVTATGANVTGTLSASGNANVGNLGTTGVFATTLSASGNANVGNIGTGTAIIATGNITTINSGLMQNGDSNVQIYQDAAVAISVNGNANVVFVSPTGMEVTGSIGGTTTLSITGNANVGNLGTTGVFATTISASGNANAGNLGTTGVFATTLSASGNANVGNIGTAGLITATGNLNAGNIITAGIVSATGNITGGFFIGNGSQLTGIDATSIQNGNSNVKVYANSAVTTSVAGTANVLLVSATGLEITGLTSTTGNATAGNLITGGIVTATGNITGANLITAGSLIAPAMVQNAGAYDTRLTLDSANGIITANTNGNATQLLPSGSIRLDIGGTKQIVGGTSDGSILALANSVVSISQLQGGNVLLHTGTSNTVTHTWNFDPNGNLSAPGAISATGNVTGGNLITGGVLSVTGNASVGNLIAGSGSGGNISGANNISANTFTGTLTTAAQPNITSLGTLTSASVAGNANVGNIGTSGLLTASGNITSGSNVVTDYIAGKTSGVSITATGSNQSINLTPTGTGTVDVGTFRISNLATPTQTADAATKQYVDNLAASGIHYHEPVFVESPDTAGNLNATYNNGTSGVGATLTNAGTQAALTIDGVLMTVGKRVLIYNQTNQFENGVYTVTTVGNGSTNWVLTRATDADTYDPFSPDALGQGDAFFVTNGDTGAGETYICNTVGTITFGTTAITFAQISDSTLYTAGTGLTLTGTAFSVNASQTQVTSVGTLTSLSISGNANIGNVGASAGIFSTVAGSLTTAAQPNVTSLGTLSSLGVNGTVTAVALTANTGIISGNANGISSVQAANIVGTTLSSTVVSSSLTAVGTLASLAVTGNISAANVTATHYGAATGLTSIPGGNITGTIPSGVVPTLNQNTTGYAATVSGAAQANITSVGTLTGLSVSGNANIGNVGAATGVYTTLQATTLTTGANTTAGTVTGNFTLSTGSRFAATYS